MPYGKPIYDIEKDEFTCEFPINNADGTYTICNHVCQDLSRHIFKNHGVSVIEYKKMLGLNKSTKLISKRTRERLRNNKTLRLISRKNLQPKKHAFKKGDNTIQSYTRSPQNRARLRRLHMLRKTYRLKKTP